MIEDIFSTGNPDLDSMLKYLRETMSLSAVHADALHKLRASCHIDIANINTEIRHIQEKHPVSTSKLAAAKRRSVYREGQVALCTSYLSPMRRLPLELLEEIFILCMWMSTSTPEKTPMILRQVCAAWRTTILGISKLWDKLTLSLSSTSCDSTHENAANLLSMWLENAGTYPISLWLSYNVPHSPCSCLLEHVVTSHSNRLCRLHFHLQRNAAELDLGRFFNLPGCHVEQLEYFSLIDSANMTERDMVTVLRDAPRLRKVQILACGNISWFDMDTYPMLLPWMQLTHLHISVSLDPIICQKLLQCCTLLEYCRLDICPSISETSHPLRSLLQRTTLPNLRDIQINVESYAEAAYSWLYSFDFPILARLKYQGGEINRSWIRYFQRTLESQPHSIRILSLHSDKIATDDLIELLRSHPELTELILSLSTTTTNIVHLWAAMTFNHAINVEEGERKNSNHLLGKLEIFELYVPRDYGDELSVREYCGMVKSRWHTPLRRVLRRVKCHYARYDRNHAMTEMSNLLKECQSEGLVVWIDDWTHKRLFPDSLWRSPFRW